MSEAASGSAWWSGGVTAGGETEDEVPSAEPRMRGPDREWWGGLVGAALSAKDSRSLQCAVRTVKPRFWDCGDGASLWTESRAAGGRLPCITSRASFEGRGLGRRGSLGAFQAGSGRPQRVQDWRRLVTPCCLPAMCLRVRGLPDQGLGNQGDSDLADSPCRVSTESILSFGAAPSSRNRRHDPNCEFLSRHANKAKRKR